MKNIGILGGGQLALLLSQTAKKHGLKLWVLSPSKKDPASLNKPYWIPGDPYNRADLQSFFKKIEILSFESEFFSALLIKQAMKQTLKPTLKPTLPSKKLRVQPGTKPSEDNANKQALTNKKLWVAPSLDNLQNIQDRYRQKQLLIKHKIPTLDFIPLKFDNSKEQSQTLLELFKKWGPLVLKTRTGGYDGYGTFVIKNKEQAVCLDSRFRGNDERHGNNGKHGNDKKHGNNRSYSNKVNKGLKLDKTGFIAEKFFPFQRELALLSARNQKGQVIFFPLVESYQKNSVCLWVKGPVQHKGLPLLKKQIKEFLHKIDYQGLIAFELFEGPDSQLIVNELAPRVHNTGHYSLSAMDQDQFLVHLKAISEQNLTSPRLKTKGFAMLNLLGTAGHSKATFKNKVLDQQKAFLKQEGLDLYWYGKSEIRPGRKMGHINSCANSPDQALKKLIRIRKNISL